MSPASYDLTPQEMDLLTELLDRALRLGTAADRAKYFVLHGKLSVLSAYGEQLKKYACDLDEARRSLSRVNEELREQITALEIQCEQMKARVESLSKSAHAGAGATASGDVSPDPYRSTSPSTNATLKPS